MSYQMVLKGSVEGTGKSATFIGLGGDAIILSGTGFKYDADGYLKAGKITNMAYIDSDLSVGKAQTVTL